MFGYVRAEKPEMRLREYEYYRSVYCGLCRALGKCGGQCARMTLSYDFAFMATVRMAIEEKPPEFKARRCLTHPLKKRQMAELNDSLEFCAAASLLLSYHKIRDDISDEKGGKKLVAMIAKPFFAVMKRKPSKKYKELEQKLTVSLSELSQFEKSCQEPSVDRPAEIFGKLLSDIMAEGLSGSKEKIARKIGYHIGKWIYIVDAIDDYEDDVKKGRFNPIADAYGKNGLTEADRDGLETALTYELMEAEKAFDLIEYPDGDMKEVIFNIIYLGMPSAAKRVLSGRKENDR